MGDKHSSSYYNLSDGKTLGRSVSQLVNRSVNQRDSHSLRQSVIPSVNEPVSDSVNKPARKLSSYSAVRKVFKRQNNTLVSMKNPTKRVFVLFFLITGQIYSDTYHDHSGKIYGIHARTKGEMPPRLRISEWVANTGVCRIKTKWSLNKCAVYSLR